ncbi:MAG: right-handed parallel beta-helix repeat-containing protein, partial [Candidatus Thermoplasmatota archaeon]
MQLTVAMTSNYNRKRRSLKIIAIGGALLFILPTLMLLLRIPILGYEIELEEVAKIFNPPTRAIIFGPYTPDIEPPTGLYIRDMVGRVEKGNVTSINFTLGISHGYPALDFSDARIHFTGGDCDKYYLFYPKKETDTYPLVSVIEDPDRVWKNKHLNDNATIRVTINGFNITPGNGFSMYFMVLADKPVRIEKFFFKTPPFFTEPPLDREHNGSVRIDDDGSYPKPSEDDWVVKNITSVENIALILDKNIVILENGTFVLRNSTILINSTKEKRYGIYVGYGGKLLSFNTTISAMNTTEAEYILSEYRYNFEVYGNMIMEKSNVAYTFSGMYIYSDNVWINDSTINGTIICTYASPIITNNTIYNNGTAGIGMKKSSPIIANNTLYSVGNYLGKPVGHGIGGDLDSAPLIIDNRIMNEEVGIMVSIDSSPKIMHNRISSCTSGLIFEKTYGLAENNTIENATVGISISRWASITIVNNNISAENSIRIGPWATATIIGNNISGYKKYGIAPPSYRPVFANLSMSNNNFVPDANYTNESIG